MNDNYLIKAQLSLNNGKNNKFRDTRIMYMVALKIFHILKDFTCIYPSLRVP